jgi:DNA polymerase elongation subunit (family B)
MITKSYTFFPYQWSSEDVEENDGSFQTIIRAYGLDTNNDSVYVSIYDYCPYIFLELPVDNIDWNVSTKTTLCKKIKDMMHKFPPVSYELQFKHKLYYGNINLSGQLKKYPYLKIVFPSSISINYFKACVRKGIYVPGLRNIQVKVHESKIDPTLKFICEKNLSTSAWIDFKGMYIEEGNKESMFKHEFQCSWKDFSLNKTFTTIFPKPLIMAFDLEANSSNPYSMPDCNKPNDKIFQISCIESRHGDDEKDYKNFLLTLGDPNPIPNTTILCFKSELALLEGFSAFIQERNPNILLGYNILGFDYQYMIDRSELNRCTHNFSKQGALIGRYSEQKELKWSSAAYSENKFSYINAEGRLIVDMLPIIKRDYNLESYTLGYVGKYFKLSKFKQDLGHIGIFRCYREFSPESLAEVGQYCVMDSVVTMLLFEKLYTWVGLTEMANVCKVPIFDLYTAGQQKKCFSQIYIQSFRENTVVEQDVYKVDENDNFIGATVIKPKEGLYDNVLMFDFASLYPTIIIRYNICYRTYVIDPNIPDEMCWILEGSEHRGCEHDTEVRKSKVKKDKIICKHYKNRFLKEPKGILPMLLENLLSARTIVKKQLKQAKKDNNKMLSTVLDMRQMAVKVSANSMYGMLGVKKGPMLPLMPGAASVTAAGRMALAKTIEYIENEENGVIVYGDTDSVFAKFNFLKTPQECWEFSIKLEKRFVKLFKAPMKLEFEEKIFSQLLILSKKRYMAIVGKLVDNLVEIDADILTKGVVLTRRDNCVMLKNLYKKIVDMIFAHDDKNKVIEYILEVLTEVISWKCPTKEFIISKSVKSEESYKLVPAHAELAKKLRNRGMRVDPGTRIPYVLTTIGGILAKQSIKIEDPEYFDQHKEILRIDRLYYILKLESSIDELLLVAFGIKHFMKKFIKTQVYKNKIHKQLLSFTKPTFNLL